MQKILFFIIATPVLSNCAWHEPARVEGDFGSSVRQMIAEQLYDPQIARDPSQAALEALGSSAQSSIDGVETASQQARVQRTSTTGSPIPVVGTTSGEN